MPESNTFRLLMLLAVILLIPLLVGCGLTNPSRPVIEGTPQPAPTLSSAFGPRQETVTKPLDPTEGPIQVPTRSADNEQSSATNAELDLIEVSVYRDSVDENWSLENSLQVSVEPRSSANAQGGRYAVAAKPTLGEGTLYFTLNKTTGSMLRREDVQALRFHLSGGDNVIDRGRFAVAVVGSNETPYWRPNDTSVQIPGRVTDDFPVFSETLLVFLGINKDIPADEWVQVDVWLDDLLYDPDYEFVTGFYFKADRRDVPVFYVDNVSLLVKRNPRNP